MEDIYIKAMETIFSLSKVISVVTCRICYLENELGSG